ncbi:hypothetical protein [Chryseobacterium culicis]|uniref:Uncharacterized protein n=1 Tax=Chryseobacterium culicis TaxID=680127 RepID=A0A1H6HEI8_CHRCI|nr:hypothetical protein [Chryseobacterium culicis]SEH32510.1 hypothetical protein SAMN05421593_1824 [Chryseobacterium culicis]
MIKNTKLLLLTICTGASYNAQVGINTTTPQATLHIQSKGNSASTNAFKINNSAATEILTTTDNGNLGVGVSSPQKRIDIDANSDALRFRNLIRTTSGNADGTITVLNYNTANGDIANRVTKQVQTVTLANNATATLTDATGGINGTLLIRSATNSSSAGANITATFNYARRGLGLLGIAVDSATAPTFTRGNAGDGIGVLYTISAGDFSFTITKPTLNSITITNTSGASRGFIISTEPL